jgi:serine/threonine-protein kinase
MFVQSVPAAPRVPTAPGVQGGNAQPTPGSLLAWSREQLAEVERQLTPIVGPMAPILVRRAAANTANRRQLYEQLANHLRTAEERRRFLQGESAIKDPASHQGATGQSGEPLSVTRISGIQRGRPVTPETTLRAGRLLAQYLGPIATVVAKKAAETAADEAHLYSLLAAKLQDPVERDQFIDAASRSG